MSKMMRRLAGAAILVATVGVASCQALWMEAPALVLPMVGGG
jgi:hypothetical protein